MDNFKSTKIQRGDEMEVCEFTNVFKDRLKELIEESEFNQREVAGKIGISKQTISFYVNGKRLPDIDNTYKLCKFFHVSADYLLGLSDVKSFDLDIKAISEKTGLSERAIKEINRFRNKDSTLSVAEFRLDFLNGLLTEYYFYSLIDKIIGFVETKTDTDESKERCLRKYCDLKGIDYEKLSFDYRDPEFVEFESNFNDFYHYFDMKLGESSINDIGYREYLVIKAFEKLIDHIKYDYREIILNGERFSREFESEQEILDRALEYQLKIFEEQGAAALFTLKSNESLKKFKQILNNGNED